MTRLPILLACLFLAVFAACGDDDEQEAAATPEPTAETTPEPAAEPEAAPEGEIDVASISEKLSKKPAPEIPSDSTPPAELITEDIVKGQGKAAKAGDTVSMQYAGYNWSNGQPFDASWDRGKQPFEFGLGGGMVIPGWDEGIVGMKEGGRRLLVIPPELGYGPAGSPPVIGPNETLVFVVDLEKIK
jgi:peptidylprolyl isomerase